MSTYNWVSILQFLTVVLNSSCVAISWKSKCRLWCHGVVVKHALFFFSELCWGKAVVAYTMPQQRKKEESKGLRGEREIRSSLFALDLKDGKLEDSGKQEEGKTFHKLHVLGMNDDL